MNALCALSQMRTTGRVMAACFCLIALFPIGKELRMSFAASAGPTNQVVAEFSGSGKGPTGTFETKDDWAVVWITRTGDKIEIVSENGEQELDEDWCYSGMGKHVGYSVFKSGEKIQLDPSFELEKPFQMIKCLSVRKGGRFHVEFHSKSPGPWKVQVYQLSGRID